MNKFIIKDLIVDDLPDALRLIWETFLEFEAPEYSDEGIREFAKFIEFNSIASMQTQSELFLWGCFDRDKLIGVIAIKLPCHISLFFVDKNYHRQGIARALYKTVLKYYVKKNGHTTVTVNSSPYALKVYRRLGFADTGPEQLVKGIRFIPMKHEPAADDFADQKPVGVQR